MRSQLGWKAFIDLGRVEEVRVFSSKRKAVQFSFSKLPRKFRVGNPAEAIKKFKTAERLAGNWTTVEIRKLMDGQQIL